MSMGKCLFCGNDLEDICGTAFCSNCDICDICHCPTVDCECGQYDKIKDKKNG